jgi:hypothetical protein
LQDDGVAELFEVVDEASRAVLGIPSPLVTRAFTARSAA